MLNMIFWILFFCLLAVLLIRRYTTDTKRGSGFAWESPDWAKNAVIYEVSVRHFSKEGTIAEVEKQLPRLRHLGVDIIWLMPIFPISQEKKKGSLGSPYAVSDYKAVNPDLGSIDDVKSLVKTAHQLGIKVILDWVPNHTGWSHAWIIEHPDKYQQIDGQIIDPIEPATGKSWGWTDVAALDYSVPKLRNAMMDAFIFWIKETDIDGFRCDVAGPVPVDFWKTVRIELNKHKTVFMLAEWENVPEHFEVCFESNYAWRLHHLMQAIAKGTKKAAQLKDYLIEDRKLFVPQGYHMTFTTNHDENAWIGTEEEMFGEGKNCFTAFYFCWEGMPLIFNGQEAALNKRLAFFEPDYIDWKTTPHADFLRLLADLHHRNEALWHGLAGGPVELYDQSDRRAVVFSRSKNNHRIVAAFNMSAESLEVSLPASKHTDWQVALSGSTTNGTLPSKLTLGPWEFRIYTNC